MAQKRVDVLNRSGGPLSLAEKDKKEAQAVLQKLYASSSSSQRGSGSDVATTNSGNHQSVQQVSKAKSELNRSIQSMGSSQLQLKHAQEAVDIFKTAAQKIQKAYEQNPTESNKSALERATTALSSAASRQQTLLQQLDADRNDAAQKQEAFQRASEAYYKYMPVRRKVDSIVSERVAKQPETIITRDALTFQEDMAQIEKMSKQDRQDLQTYALWKENNFSGVQDANSVDVVWVPGQGLQSVSGRLKAAEAMNRLKAKGYTDQQISALSQTYSRKLNADSAKQLQEGASQLAERSPVLANIARLPANLAGGTLGALDYGIESLQTALGQERRYSTMDPNLAGSALSQISDSIYSTTRENIEQSKAGKLGGIAYGAATSLADNLLRFYAGGGSKAITLATAGASAFQGSVREATERGGTASQAALKGIADAASEVLTELLPLDNIIKLKTADIGSVANLLKEVLKQSGTEIATEEINYGVGLLSDWLIMGDKSQANLQKQQLMASGMSEKEAEKQVVRDILLEAGNLAAETALSAGAQAGIEGGANLYRSNVNPTSDPQAQKNTASDETAADNNQYAVTGNIVKDMPSQQRYSILKDKTVNLIYDEKSIEHPQEMSSLAALKARAKSKAQAIITPLAKKLGILNRPLSTPDIEVDFQFSNGGLNESMHKQLRYGGNYQDFAKTIVNLDEVLKNAVLIESHSDKYAGTSRENRNLENVYVLFGAFKDGNTIIPVQAEIKKTSDAGSRLYMTVAMTKIEADVLEETVSESQASPLISASDISIQDLFAKINPKDAHFLKYLPDEFLNESQLSAKQSALDEDARRIERLKTKNGSIATPESVQADSEGNYVRIEESPSGNSKNGVTDGAGDSGKAGVTARPEELSEGSNPAAAATPMPLPDNIIPNKQETVNTENASVGAADAPTSLREATQTGGAISQNTELTPEQKGAQKLQDLFDQAKRLFGKEQSSVDTNTQTAYDKENTQGGADDGTRGPDNSRDRRVSPIYSEGQAGASDAGRTELYRTLRESGDSQRTSGGGVQGRDSEGREVTQDISTRLQGTSVVDANNLPIPMYHTTDNMEFTEFQKGDVGFHFGSLAQAEKHANNRRYENGRTFRVYLNIRNPVTIASDIMNWHANASAMRLFSEGVINGAEYQQILSLWSNEKSGYNDPASVKLREILESKGYDGIKYPNGYEGSGDSYIAFRDRQIIRSEITPLATGKNNSVGAADTGFTGYSGQYNDLLSDKTAQRDRPGDVRYTEVPTKDPFGRNVSEFVGNVYGSAVTPDSFIPVIEELVVEGALGHDVKSHKETLQEAASWISERGAESAKTAIGNTALSGKASDKDIAAAMLLYTEYANSEEQSSQDSAAELFVNLSEMATNAGRNLNLFKYFRKMTPQGQLLTVQKNVHRYVDQLNKNRSNRNQAKVSIPQELWDQYLEAAESASKDNATQEDINHRNEAEQEIYKVAASQIRSTLKEKWDAWRHMAMLGNVKTQARNLGGNVAFRPYVTAKRAIGAALESAFRVPQEQRTKAIIGLGKDGRQLIKLAASDAKTASAAEAMSGSAKTGDLKETDISEYRKIFGYTAKADTSKAPEAVKKAREAANKGLEATRNGITALMEGTDMVFKRWEYTNALASFIKARGYNAKQWEAGQIPLPVMEQARSYAANEAMKATFNDHNVVSDYLSKNLRAKGDDWFSKTMNFIGEGIFPYRRTPANVAVRAVEYGPFNLARSAVNAAWKVRKGKMTASQCIDQLASGLTGTGAMMLGAALASGLFGIRLVGAQDDEDEERMGHQAYSLEIGGKSYTVDWAAPANIPLFVGANIYKAFAEKGGDDVSVIAKIFTELSNTFEPMLELSCLSSFNDLAESVRYSQEGDAVYTVAAQIATSYFMQGLPTLGSQLDQLGDDTRQMVYAPSEDTTERALQKFVGKASQRLPGDLYQTEYVDAWGRTSATKWFESIFSPTYSKDIDENPVDLEIQRLNKAQDENVSPSTPAYTVTVDGKRQRLTGEQWTKLAKEQGQMAYKLVSQVIQSEDYGQLSDVQKAKAIEDVYEYAREYARVSTIDGYDKYSAAWMENITGKEAQTVIERAIVSASGLGSDARYSRATELGVDLSEMQKVSSAVTQALAEAESKTDYDTYRAVLSSVAEDDAAKWLQIYGMSESRLEAMEAAKKKGIRSVTFVNYLQVESQLDKAFKEITTAWENGKTPTLDSLSAAYEAFENLPGGARDYFQDQMGGKMAAFADAMDAGIQESTFVDLWKQYYRLGSSANAQSENANQWAAILDKAKDNGRITEKQRDVLWNGLSFYSQIRQDAAKYHELTGEGLNPDVALYVQKVMEDLSTKKEKLNAISSADLSDAGKESAARAYLDDDQEKQLDAFLDMGLDFELYASLYEIYCGESGTGKKNRTIEKFRQQYGLDNATASAIYTLYSGR